MKASHPLARAMEFYGTRLKHPGQERVHAWLRARLNVEIDEDREVRRQGLMWRLNPADFTQREMYWFGERDRWDFSRFSRFAPPNATVFDVGANFGYYSIMLASLLNRAARIHAFEPFPTTFRRLETNIALNRMQGVVIPHQVAFGDAVGRSAIHTADANRHSGAATLAGGPDSTGVTLRGAGDVEVSTIDRFVQDEGITRVDLIKIDVEGLELKVLQGAQRTLHEHQPILMVELHPRTLSRVGVTPADVAAFLRNCRYTLYRTRRDKTVPLTSLPSDGSIVNAFAVPSNRQAPLD